ncbi:hypothetical protein N7495_004658 [Penicillium taxi]|uniref:uncharacterized protein n=1 Tax=Penicillium taxi TaxID=168475 RepID=UPI00254543DC|nr:uncharacterized protein N7495_004658 [Penicillium taxi]KAJ5899914.1 hypothetical protein N7495_004658 [Penicillium taxi]
MDSLSFLSGYLYCDGVCQTLFAVYKTPDPNIDLTFRESGVIMKYLMERYDVSRKISFEPGSKAQLAPSGQGLYYGQACWFKKLHPKWVPSVVQRYMNEINRVSGL